MTPRSLVRIASAAAALSLVVTPAVASPLDQGGDPPSSPGQSASLPQQAKAYGRYCQGQSKKRVPGQKRTPFSQCVTAMAKLSHGVTDSPREACKALSRKHVKGEKGTPFSRCVAAGAKLLHAQAEQDGD